MLCGGITLCDNDSFDSGLCNNPPSATNNALEHVYLIDINYSANNTLVVNSIFDEVGMAAICVRSLNFT